MAIVENIRCHFLAVGDLVVFDGRWRMVISKGGALDEGGKKKYPLELRDASGATVKYKVRAETALRVIAAPLVPPEAEARFLLTGGV